MFWREDKLKPVWNSQEAFPCFFGGVYPEVIQYKSYTVIPDYESSNFFRGEMESPPFCVLPTVPVTTPLCRSLSAKREVVSTLMHSYSPVTCEGFPWTNGSYFDFYDIAWIFSFSSNDILMIPLSSGIIMPSLIISTSLYTHEGQWSSSPQSQDPSPSHNTWPGEIYLFSYWLLKVLHRPALSPSHIQWPRYRFYGYTYYLLD